MKATGWVRALVVSALLASACGPAPATGSVSSPSPSPSPNPTPTTVPTPIQPGQCLAPTNRCLAVVTLRGSTQVVVRDITDIGHATTVGALGSPSDFVSATQLSYVDGNSLITVPLAGTPKSPVAHSTLGVSYFDWSPDGTTAAYLSTRVNGPDTTMELHLVSNGTDRTVVGSAPGPPAGFGCEAQSCVDSWDLHFGYSPDGRFLTWTQNVNFSFRMWTAAGADVTPPISYLSMSVWSGPNMYFRDMKGVKVWRNGVISSFLPGVAWIRPKASPGGGQIVYETRDASGVAHTLMVDTRTHKVRELAKFRAEPVFLTSRYIWYRGERRCTAADQCVPGGNVASGKTYIYDLQTGAETESIITSVSDVWPHAA